MEKITVVSAPGKVLVAGGYLVLDRTYTGVVFGTSARFYCAIRRVGTSTDAIRVSVRSPQFEDGSWNYEVGFTEQRDGCRLTAIGAGQRNRYVEVTIVHCLSLCLAGAKDFSARLGSGLDIVIVGDNDFYSQREQLKRASLPLTTASLASLERFCATHSTIGDVHKTGLGSSAAMITSLTAALLSHFGVVSIPSENAASPAERTGIRLVHDAAQFCHCLAQGKIGSGFDVSSAVYGSHVYRRFSPSVLDGLLRLAESGEASREVTVRGPDLTCVLGTDRWDNDVQRVNLPPGFTLALADIDAGSSTPKLVSQVLAWRKAKAEEDLFLAHRVWTDIDESNRALIQTLQKLSDLATAEPAAYEEVRRECQAIPARDGIRAYLREMSKLAGVPIEPEEQTRLLDACNAVSGVIMAGVPGAGGFDAIFCVTVDPSCRDALERVWSSWTEMAVAPLLASDSKTGLMEVELPPELRRHFAWL
ncbi:phosphomevalonate kinase [Rhizophlyctis rosea]|uniref:Phosphomevalonate kinase n=1 Tax=Rhizophlyctis rosea TaxID=64517 RepID=A0AAD5SME5_9FUNG|nr:phosphomevalonate kinase [Rhizophlyctis rosea]